MQRALSFRNQSGVSFFSKCIDAYVIIPFPISLIELVDIDLGFFVSFDAVNVVNVPGHSKVSVNVEVSANRVEYAKSESHAWLLAESVGIYDAIHKYYKFS